MDTQHGILSPMSKPRDRLLTATALEDLEYHEIVNGELVQKASPSFRHSITQGRIILALGGFQHGQGSVAGPGPGGWWIGSEPTIELARHEVYHPDVAGWRIDRVPAIPEGPVVRLVPDWVCEILSPSTEDRDLGHKLRTYHRAHVGHYWVIEPALQTLRVYRWEDADYVPALSARAGDVVRAEPFGAIAIAVAEIFGMPPAAR